MEKVINQKMKTTSIGLIPEDWDAKSLSQIGVFSKGKGVTRANAQSGIIPCVRYGEIYTSHNDYIRTFYSHISPEVAATATMLKKGDVLFAGSGETKEEIGKAVAFLGDEEAYAGGDIIILSPNEGASSKYLGYVLNAATAVNQKASMGQGDAVVHIHAKELSDVVIPFPKLEEQEKIADALSGVDDIIGALDEAIAKKQQIKEGLMRRLLTPQSGSKWVERLGRELFSIGNGRDYKSLGSGSIPVYGTGGLMASVDDYLYDGPTVCIGRKGTIDRPQFHEGKIWTVDTLFYTYDFKGVNPKFLYYLFCRVNWHALNEATGVPSLTSNNILNVCFLLPSEEEEQRSIVTILDAVEDEIVALDNKRQKYSLIKKGMMQELLTGKTRLI